MKKNHSRKQQRENKEERSKDMSMNSFNKSFLSRNEKNDNNTIVCCHIFPWTGNDSNDNKKDKK